MTPPAALYHYTCDERAPLIERAGRLMPYPQALLGGRPLVWLTDMAEPDMCALGLTGDTLTCDRTAYRATVTDLGGTLPWGQWAHHHAVPMVTRDLLEFGAFPAHWWVADEPLPVALIAATTRPQPTQ